MLETENRMLYFNIPKLMTGLYLPIMQVKT